MNSHFQLLSDVLNNNIDQLTLAFENQLDPNLYNIKISGDEYGVQFEVKQPIIFSVRSPEMMVLLLEHGANPNLCSYRGDRLGHQSLSLLLNLALSNAYDLIITLINHTTFPLDNDDINAAINAILGTVRQPSKRTKFLWKDNQKEALLLLIQLSTDLQKDVLVGNSRMSPYEYINVMLKDEYHSEYGCEILNLMLTNNFFLIHELLTTDFDTYLYTKFSHFELQHTDLIFNHSNNGLLFNCLNTYKVWQLLLLSSMDTNSKAMVPKDIFEEVSKYLIAQLLVIMDFRVNHEIFQQSKQKLEALVDKRNHFNKYYTIMIEYCDLVSNHTFLKEDNSKSAFKFFERVDEKARVEPQSQTAAVLNLCNQHLSDEKSASALAEHILINKIKNPLTNKFFIVNANNFRQITADELKDEIKGKLVCK